MPGQKMPSPTSESAASTIAMASSMFGVTPPKPRVNSLNSVEPMSPQEFSRGLMRRAMIGAVIILIGVIPMIMAGREGIWAWFDEPLFGDTSRALGWMILMVLIEGAVMTSYILTATRRTAAWRQQNGGTDPS